MWRAWGVRHRRRGNDLWESQICRLWSLWGPRGGQTSLPPPWLLLLLRQRRPWGGHGGGKIHQIWDPDLTYAPRDPTWNSPPPTIDTECNEQTKVDGDEALRMIVSRVKEDKKRKKRLQEAEAATIATLEGSRGQVRKGNFSAREVRDPPNSIPTPPIFQCNHSYVFPVILFYF